MIVFTHSSRVERARTLLVEMYVATCPSSKRIQDMASAMGVKQCRYERKDETCIQCGLCHIACEDTAHQAIMKEKDGARHFEVMDSECVGCNLCMHVCPVEQCITMERVDNGEYANWITHPNNPARVDAGEGGKSDAVETAEHADAHAAKAA